MRDELSELAFATGWGAVRRMPEPVARATFQAMADQAWVRHTASVQQLERNLRRVVPHAGSRELRELSRDSMRSYFRYWSEVFRLPDWSNERIVTTLLCEDEVILRDALSAGGAVLSLPHAGNWDHAGAWACLTLQPLTTVAERLRPEGLYERFLAYRRALGMEVLPLSGAGGPFRTLLQRARDGHLICLLGDRDLTANGVPVSFFGERATMPAGPAALALASGAPLLPVTAWYEDGCSCVRIHPAVPEPTMGSRSEKVAAMTQVVADTFAGGIRKHPQDWHMLQPLWSADLRGRRAPEAPAHEAAATEAGP
jgi:KDO2-lipid IV(A) lauroyltransferase